MQTRALAVLGRGLVPVDTPLVRADDAGLTRGDGVFETLHVRAGRPWLLDEHLRRMANSAAALGLPLPPAAALADLVTTALTGWPGDAPAAEAGLKLVCTRGPDSAVPATPTTFATVFDVSPEQRRQRRDGVRVLTASLGVTVDARGSAPWLLGGAKSLSYATNMAAQRWATGQGRDDVILLSAEGQVLEGPTSTVVWAAGDTLRTVPTDTGILAGTTAAYLLDHAAELGLRAERRRAVVEDLLAADEVWLCSSVRGAARVVELDGKPLGPPRLTPAVHQLLGFPV